MERDNLQGREPPSHFSKRSDVSGWYNYCIGPSSLVSVLSPRSESHATPLSNRLLFQRLAKLNEVFYPRVTTCYEVHVIGEV